MILELLRKHQVDILKYLPYFLSKDPRFKLTGDVLSEEHERLRLEIDDLTRQFFVETATWGLDDWERVYGLTHGKSDGYDIRRGRLKAKIQGTGTVTNEMMNQLINSVVPTKDARYIDNVAPNQFRIEVGTATALAEIKKIVDMYKPAHLTYTLAHLITTEGIIYVGGVISNFRETDIPAPEHPDITIAERPLYVGGVITLAKSIKIGE